MTSKPIAGPEVFRHSPTRTSEHEHVSPIVRALPMSTAHPLEEAWPPASWVPSRSPAPAPPRARPAPCRPPAEHGRRRAIRSPSARVLSGPREEDQSARFAKLQERMAEVDAAVRASRQRRSIVVVPYGTTDRWHQPPAEVQAYEERLLCWLLELRDPDLQVTYVTSSPIAPTIIDYYLSLLPRDARRHARRRLTLVALGDHGTRSLSEKLLERPCVIERIRRAIPDPWWAHLVPYRTTTLERNLALALDIPIYGADPHYAHFGSKSGSRELFALAGIPYPLGVAHISSIPGAIHAITRLRVIKPDLAELVMKLNEGVSGEGNAIIDLAGLPQPGTPAEAQRIQQRLSTLVPEANGVSAAAYLAKLATHGCVVEERITGRELRSPSVQLQVTPLGQVEVLSTHDQILGGPSGQRYMGCRFPAEPSYASAIGTLARRVGQRLADTGVIGRFAIDFVVARRDDNHWEPFAVDLNLRKGGTSHPYQTLTRLVGGSYDADSATFSTLSGHRKHYVATDHLQAPQLRVLGRDGVLALARRSDLRFDRTRRSGTVFHMLSSLDELGRVGFTAIGDSPEEADALSNHVQTTLIAHADHANSSSLARTETSKPPDAQSGFQTGDADIGATGAVVLLGTGTAAAGAGRRRSAHRPVIH